MKAKNTTSLDVHPMIQSEIVRSVRRSLKCLPRKVYGMGRLSPEVYVYEIDGELYDEDAAVNKILGQYSWIRKELVS